MRYGHVCTRRVISRSSDDRKLPNNNKTIYKQSQSILLLLLLLHKSVNHAKVVDFGASSEINFRCCKGPLIAGPDDRPLEWVIVAGVFTPNDGSYANHREERPSEADMQMSAVHLPITLPTEDQGCC